MNTENLTHLLQLAGVLHLGLLCAGVLMPRAVNLKAHLATLPVFIRRLFWVYYTFIGLCLVSFGLITVMFAGTLAAGGSLARAVCAFLAVFWTIRLIAATFVFDVRPYLGDGRQFVSWIHETDFCRATEWLITHSKLSGAVNIAAPNPITNAEMMEQLRAIYRMPIGLPAAKWMLEIGAFLLRTETELIIKSRRVVSRRLIESGFTFQFPFLRAALKNLQLKPED